jgi:hypothetical protein
MDDATTAAQDPRIAELSTAYDTIQYIKSVLNENVIHGEEAFKTVAALNWLENLGNALRVQAQVFQQQNLAANPQTPTEVNR